MKREHGSYVISVLKTFQILFYIFLIKSILSFLHLCFFYLETLIKHDNNLMLILNKISYILINHA